MSEPLAFLQLRKVTKGELLRFCIVHWCLLLFSYCRYKSVSGIANQRYLAVIRVAEKLTHILPLRAINNIFIVFC
jgi:hypothetical protein